MLAERLTVIAEHDDEGAVEAAVGGQVTQEAPDLQIGRGNLRIVRAHHGRRKTGAHRLGRVVWRVRFVEMDPRKEGPSCLLVQPFDRLVDHFARRTLYRIEPGFHFVFRQIEIVEISIEPLVDAPAPVEHERRHEAAGPIAARAQHFGERHLIVAQVETAVVADAVIARKGSGHQRRVRRKRQRRDGGRLAEAQTPSGQRVERRRLRSGVPVASQVVGAKRVDGDQQDIRAATATKARHGVPRRGRDGDRDDDRDRST